MYCCGIKRGIQKILGVAEGTLYGRTRNEWKKNKAAPEGM